MGSLVNFSVKVFLDPANANTLENFNNRANLEPSAKPFWHLADKSTGEDSSSSYYERFQLPTMDVNSLTLLLSTLTISGAVRPYTLLHKLVQD